MFLAQLAIYIYIYIYIYIVISFRPLCPKAVVTDFVLART